MTYHPESTARSPHRSQTPKTAEPGRRVLFNLGRVVATPGAMTLLESADTSPVALLAQHQTGQWGSVCCEDAQANEDALCHGARLLSCYEVAGERLWLITEADRSATTLLLPSEY